MKNRVISADEHSFLGQGWGFPIRFDTKTGSVELVGGVEDIEQSLRIILNTLPGERATNLKFGCKAKEKMYDPVDGKFTLLAEEAIQTAIDFYEPRIKLESLNVNYDQKNEGVVLLELNYVVKLTNSRHNMVHPFSDLEANI